MRKIYAVTER